MGQAVKSAETRTKAEMAELRIVGRGTLAESGLPFLLVSSLSEPGRVHCVAYAYEGAYVGSRLHCDCAAASYGRHCKHMRLVMAWLAEQMVSAPLAVSPPPSTSPDTPSRPDARETAILRRSNQPFSLMK